MKKASERATRRRVQQEEGGAERHRSGSTDITSITHRGPPCSVHHRRPGLSDERSSYPKSQYARAEELEPTTAGHIRIGRSPHEACSPEAHEGTLSAASLRENRRAHGSPLREAATAGRLHARGACAHGRGSAP